MTEGEGGRNRVPPAPRTRRAPTEGDDMTEPIADETRSILDGHIVLSRKLGAANHYPAIDVLASASRVMNAVVTPEHKRMAGRLRPGGGPAAGAAEPSLGEAAAMHLRCLTIPAVCAISRSCRPTHKRQWRRRQWQPAARASARRVEPPAGQLNPWLE